MFPYGTQQQQSGPQSFQSGPSQQQQQATHDTPSSYLARGPNLVAPMQYATQQPGHWLVNSSNGTFNVPQVSFLQRFDESLQTQYTHTPSANDHEQFPHLNQTVEINERERRQASIQSPQDYARLVREAQDRHHALPYVSLTAPSFSQPDTQVNMGRVSASPFPSVAREQHYYNENSVFTPYPAEGRNLQNMATGGVSQQEVWQSLHNVGLGQPPVPQLTQHEREIRSVPTIINLSETQRSPLMGALSNLEIANQAQTAGPTISLTHAFGQNRGQVNLPGTIASTGSGAVHQFDAFATALNQGNISDQAIQGNVTRAPQGMSVGTARTLATQRRDNMLNTVQQRLDMTDIDRAMQIEDQRDREDAVVGRLLSGVSRNSMAQMGLSRYNFRPLTRPPRQDDEMSEEE